jgi:endonuclease/exonuclease/phosphatase family metal-dependent hydrolase
MPTACQKTAYGPSSAFRTAVAAPGATETPAVDRLRLLSFNIQAGIHSRRYRDYVSNGWKHILPHGERLRNLACIGALLHDYDVIGLQEVDSGSLRSGFVDQTQYLAHLGGYTHWHSQINRELGMLARHSNGILSRFRPSGVAEHKLPGLPGRGAMLAEFPTSSGEPVAVCVLHLALGWRARRRQLDYLVELMGQYRFAVLMGDFNCSSRSATLRSVIADAGLQGLDEELKTFPSWRPRHNLDHILVSPALRISEARVLDYALSDHLPISMEVQLPDGVTVG